MKVQALLDGVEIVVGELEDIVLHYVHNNLPYNISKNFPHNKNMDVKNTSRQCYINMGK